MINPSAIVPSPFLFSLAILLPFRFQWQQDGIISDLPALA
jgi:hypothetical protein